MTFIATGSDAAPDQQLIENDTFWPAVDPVLARVEMRLDGTVTDERLTAELIEAMATANADLVEWRALQQAAGFATLADVPAPKIGGTSLHLQRYQRAVRCLAAANLTERYRSFDATGAGNKHADALESPIDDLRRDARWAISEILGRPRSTVELI